jgi:hypothetical protein
VIAASQTVYCGARFPRAFFRPQIDSTPNSDIRRNCPFANSFSPLHLRNDLKRRIRSYRHAARNPFIPLHLRAHLARRIRSYKHFGGVGGAPLSTFSHVPSAHSVNSTIGLSSPRLSPSETNNLQRTTVNLSQVASHKSRLFMRLRALELSCSFISYRRPLFSIVCGLFYKNTGGGVSRTTLRDTRGGVPSTDFHESQVTSHQSRHVANYL